jgi:7-cyano-7-deazaguanine synthase
MTNGEIPKEEGIRHWVTGDSTIPLMVASGTPLAVLVSGGLDSAILLGTAVRDHSAVYPLYIRSGLSWESAERECLDRFLARVPDPKPRPTVSLSIPVDDLYGEHWSLSGKCVPGAETPDEAVYLPGRNVLFLSKALLWCHLHDVPTLALGTLHRNPFPDATPEFFASFTAAVNVAVGGKVRVEIPFAGLTKAEVIRRGRDLPLGHTLSCLSPIDGRHCGRCNKCAERRAAFKEAEVADPTDYALSRCAARRSSRQWR